MIHISDIAQRIENFLLKKHEHKFKIFIRINFNVDVYVVTTNVVIAQDYQKEFCDSLLKESQNSLVDDFYKAHVDSLKINFNIIDEEDAVDDPFYDNMFKDGEPIDWGPRYRFDSLLQGKQTDLESNTAKKSTPIVTFYSYKGGMGRTTTMVAYALSLAANQDVAKRKRVVIIDCDLEAPGYLNFFDLSEHEGLKSGKKNGLVEFICDAQFTKDPQNLDINDYIVNVGLDNKNSFAYNNLDNIWLVPAGNLNEGYSDVESMSDRTDYLEGLAKINLSSVQNVVKYFNLLFTKIKETISPDIILIDSRTGFNDIFGTAALYLSDSVVGFFGFSRQTQPGLTNLLKEYYKSSNSFKLQLVFSILPEKVEEDWLDKHEQSIRHYINYIGNENRDFPTFFYLHRNSLFEKVGTGDEQSDAEFVKVVREAKFDDYNRLFDHINDLFFKNVSEQAFSSETPAIQLRNIVLKHLKNALANVSNFAEDTDIKEDQFFYRKCMKALFDPQKFLIQGYKGTGKTYLYKALANNEIASNIQKWHDKDKKDKDVLEPMFVNILPAYESALVFANIRYSSIDEPEYYFNAFWQIYTWNKLLLCSEFSSIKEQSELCDYVKPLEGALYANEALVRIEKLIEKGVSTLIAIGKDIQKINELLVTSGKRLFVLYDRLDTCINPLRWDKAVSPLINYWWNNCKSFSNISPKIFVRTDLFRLIEGTNTGRLETSIIHIEWTIGEVFGFFFKLIFSDSKASEAYWAIAKKVSVNESYIKNTQNSFENFPKNQFKSLSRAEMDRIIKVFFGNYVKVGTATLGTPWEYFEKELANADNTAICLRPFINTLNANAVDKALARTEKYVRNGIISPEIYASKSVRDEATERYFDDLTHDAFSKDLARFKEVIRTSIGEPYRFKSLSENQFEKLIELTFSRISESEVVKSTDDLKRLIFANGIMARKVTTKGCFYRFAPIYWYSWGLKNSVLEKEESKRISYEDLTKEGKPIDGEKYEGTIIKVYSFKKIKTDVFPYPLRMEGCDTSELYEDDVVVFVAKSRPKDKNRKGVYWFATEVKLKEDR